MMKNSSKKSLPSDYGSEKSDLIPDSENPVPVEIDTSVNQNNDEEYEADFGYGIQKYGREKNIAGD